MEPRLQLLWPDYYWAIITHFKMGVEGIRRPLKAINMPFKRVFDRGLEGIWRTLKMTRKTVLNHINQA